MAGCEIRQKGDASVFVGRAIVYDQWSELLYASSWFVGIREKIAPGAFDESLASDREIFCTVDHDPRRTLGRTNSGTLRLTPDDKGIAVECDIGDYSYARDLQVAMQRGDLDGMSFIMEIIDVEHQRPEKRDEPHQEIVKKANLYEVSFVFTPAYQQTSAGMRSDAPIAWPVEGERRRVAAAQASGRPSLAMRRRRLRLLELEAQV